jgi:hypothetical protein
VTDTCTPGASAAPHEQSIVIIGTAGTPAPEVLRDGSAIRRTVADRHGARRREQGWSEATVSRGYDVPCLGAKRSLGVFARRYIRHPSRFHVASDQVNSAATATAPL